MVVPASFWNKDDYYAEELGRDDAVGPGCLDQMGKDLPIVPIAMSPLTFGILLPTYAPEPVFDVLGAHPGSTRRSAIQELAGCKQYFLV